MNDPMEGIFSYVPGTIPHEVQGEIFHQKNRRRICSFSGSKAFESPTMWGYYANGFKGVTFEIEIDESDESKVFCRNGVPIKIEINGGLIHKVRYSSAVATWVMKASHRNRDEMLLRVLTTKLKSWQIEDEYRFVCEADADGLRPIGKIAAVHIGWAHESVTNAHDIDAHAPSLRAYKERARRFLEEAKKCRIPCFTARPKGNKVISKPFDGGGLT